MGNERIVAIDDEPKLLRLVKVNLESAGYEVLCAGDGTTGMELVMKNEPDLVILDLLLPGRIDGYEVCRRVREFSDVPIVMLTARIREQDKLAGFAAGADDYITKPFSSAELLARVSAILRRSRPDELNQHSLTIGSITIDLGQRRVYIKGVEVLLTRTEYRLLHQLAVNAGKVMLREELLARVWGPEYREDVDYLRVYVNHLRRKLEPDSKHPRYIKCRPGLGYYLDDCGQPPADN